MLRPTRLPRSNPVPTTDIRTHSTGGWRSAQPTSTLASVRSGTTSALPNDSSTSRRSRSRAGKPPGRRWRRCCCRDSTCSCSTNRRTTSISTDSTDSSGGFSASMHAVLLVSHDRSFLRRTITDVVEIDHHSHRATWFAGGWESFLAERELARQHARERFEEYDTKRSALQQRAQREREWASQGSVEGEEVGRERQAHPPLQGQPDRTTRRQGGADPEGGRPSRSGRGAEGAVGTAVDDPHHRPQRGRGGHGSWRRGRAGLVPARPGRSRPAPGRPGGAGRAERQREDHVDLAAAGAVGS